MHYKDSQNTLYWLEASEDPVRWLPEGCIAISNEEAEALRPKPPEPTYQQLRAAAYPSIHDQLDLLYHGGMDAWKAAITAVKEEFPK